MKIIPTNITNTTKKYARKLIIPAAFATGLTACVEAPSNGICKQVTMQQQFQADTFEGDKKVKTIQAKEFNNNEKLFQKAIFQALPHINDGKFKKLEIMKNGIILDGEYRLYKIDENFYKGSYNLFDYHSFKMDKLKNGNFNLIYKKDDVIESIAFSKDGKLLSKFEAFEQNTKDGPIKIDFNYAPGSHRTRRKNTDDKIVKFNNPLLGKEFDFVKNLILQADDPVEIVDIKQEGGKIIFNYNRKEHIGNPDGTRILTVENPSGLYFEDAVGVPVPFGHNFWYLNIRKLENGGYVTRQGLGDYHYFDKDFNEKDKDWYKQDKALREKEQSETRMKMALENIENGKPALYY